MKVYLVAQTGDNVKLLRANHTGIVVKEKTPDHVSDYGVTARICFVKIDGSGHVIKIHADDLEVLDR